MVKLKKATIPEYDAAVILGISIPKVSMLTKTGKLQHAFGPANCYVGYYRYYRRDIAKVQKQLYETPMMVE